MKLLHGDCLEIMKQIPDKSVDMVLTSPPYDNLREYDGMTVWNESAWEKAIKESFRVLKNGGVMVWVVGDATSNGSETATSFKQAIFAISSGFNLHDTMLYEKNSSTFPAKRTGVRYTQIFEYMFVFSKGTPTTVNLICDKPNKWAGHKDYSGKLKYPVPEYSPRTNIWRYVTSKRSTGHPAPFPLELAQDHIISWSNQGDSVLDPFMGSGTTGVACVNTGRNFIGIELSEKYFEIAKERIKRASE